MTDKKIIEEVPALLRCIMYTRRLILRLLLILTYEIIFLILLIIPFVKPAFLRYI